MAEDTARLAKLEGLLEGTLPHLATKADVQSVREELSLEDTLPHLATKADVQSVREELSSVKNDTLWLKRLFWVGVGAVLIPLIETVMRLLGGG